MIYCIGNNLGKKLPGIEHSQIKRVKLFLQMGEKAKIVTLSHGVDLYENASLFSISDNIFSIYDYFQEAMGDNRYSQKNYYDMWQKDPKYRLEPVKHTTDVRVFYQEDYICYAHFYDETYQRISYINYFDGPYEKRRKIKREIFDSRGFLSNVKILGENQRVIVDSYLNPSGDEKIVCYYNEGKEISRIQLTDYNNETYYFKNKNEWHAFFLDELNQEKTIFLSDRTQSMISSVPLMETRATFIPIIHNVHLRAPYETKTSEITSPYQSIFSNLDSVSAIVASTTHQAQELNERLPETIKAYPIPVGYLESTTVKKIDFEKRNPFKIVCMARYYTEKQLLHQIKVIQSLLSKYPQIELHLFGYGDATDGYKEEKMLRKYVTEHQLSEHIFFRGYLNSLEKEYESAGAMLLSSSIEGFCLSLLEAMEHGVPVIS
ncbi:MAG: glycosyltransferase, partial [Vagococcus sp.]|uniref:glycosyltransferase n=1 Tax=Vagococcus sp. TaxID=1933889 RepID=UPI002FCBA7F8